MRAEPLMLGGIGALGLSLLISAALALLDGSPSLAEAPLVMPLLG